MRDTFGLFICFLMILSACRQETRSVKETDLKSLDSNTTHQTIATVTTTDITKGRDSISTYEFVYPHNTEDLVENHYIKLNFGHEPVTGTYYGTTDEFDEAREGYLPGFFVADIYNLEIQEDSMQFVVLCSDDDFFTKPVDLKIQNSDEAIKQGHVKWDVRLRTNMKKYRGSIQGDTIRIKDEFGDRLYLRVD